MKLKPDTLLLLAPFLTELAVAFIGGYGLRQATNRANQALERIAAAAEAPHPTLPRPSLLHRADLKPIPEPDQEPCGETWNTCAESGMPGWKISLGHAIWSIPGLRKSSLGSTAVER